MVTSSGREIFPAKIRPEFAMTEDGISATFCVILNTNKPSPAAWSRIRSNSDCPPKDGMDELPVPAVSEPVSTSFASSITRTVSY